MKLEVTRDFYMPDYDGERSKYKLSPNQTYGFYIDLIELL